jgi:hypothetical protein
MLSATDPRPDTNICDLSVGTSVRLIQDETEEYYY